MWYAIEGILGIKKEDIVNPNKMCDYKLLSSLDNNFRSVSVLVPFMKFVSITYNRFIFSFTKNNPHCSSFIGDLSHSILQ